MCCGVVSAAREEGGRRWWDGEREEGADRDGEREEGGRVDGNLQVCIIIPLWGERIICCHSYHDASPRAGFVCSQLKGGRREGRRERRRREGEGGRRERRRREGERGWREGRRREGEEGGEVGVEKE